MSEFNHLNQLENNLNSRNTNGGIHSDIQESSQIPRAQPLDQTSPNKPLTPTMTTPTGVQKHAKSARKIFLIAFLILVLALGYLAYTLVFSTNSVSSDKILVEVFAQSSVSAGEDLPLNIHIKNNNKVPLVSVVLSIKYLENSSVSSSLKTLNVEIGQIDPMQSVDKEVTLKLFGAKNDTSDIKMTLEYRLKNESAIYSKVIDKSVTIANTPVSISFEGPKTITPDNELVFKVKIKSFSEKPLKNSVIVTEFPNGFTFKSSIPSPSYGNNVYSIGDLLNGAEKEIQVKGIQSGISGELKSFNFMVGERDISDNLKVTNLYSKDSYVVLLENSFLSMNMTIGGKSLKSYYFNQGDSVKVDLNYQNNLDVSISNLKIIVALNGNAIDASSIKSYGGLYDDNTNEVFWTKDNYSQLSLVEPGESGKLQFEFKMGISLSGSEVLSMIPKVEGFIKEEGKVTSASTPVLVAIKGNVQFLPQVLYATGPITNSGPIPPQKGQKTTYTVKWSVIGNGDTFTNVLVYATLPTTVNWEMNVSDPSISYDSIKRVVSWKIGTLSGENKNKEGYFKISIIPISSQVGQPVTLVNSSFLEAVNLKTTEDVSISKNSIRTSNVADAGFIPANGNVAP